MNITRRGLLAMFAVAPLVALGRRVILWGDGKHDDSRALEIWMNGGRVFRPDGSEVGNYLTGGAFLLGRTVYVDSRRYVTAGRNFTGNSLRLREALDAAI